MSSCDLEKINAKDIPIGKLISIISKAQSIYLNNILKDLNINSSQLHVLFEIKRDSKINQDKIASRSNTNKGAIARSIKKLEDNGLVIRTIDENNRRQNIITLTDKGDEILDKSIMILNEWENSLFEDIGNKENLQVILKNLAIKSIKLNEKQVLIKNESRK